MARLAQRPRSHALDSRGADVGAMIVARADTCASRMFGAVRLATDRNMQSGFEISHRNDALATDRLGIGKF